MATKKPAAKAATTGATPAPKKPRKAKQPGMTLAQKFDLLAFVKAADQKLPDASVAEAASTQFGRKVLASSVREYRKQFGIASVGKPSVAQLMARIGALEALLVQHHLPVPPIAAAPQTAVDVDTGAPVNSETQAA